MRAASHAMRDDEIAGEKSRRKRAGDPKTQQAARAAGNRRLELRRKTVRSAGPDDQGNVRRDGDSRLGGEPRNDDQRHQRLPKSKRVRHTVRHPDARQSRNHLMSPTLGAFDVGCGPQPFVTPGRT